MNAVWPQPLDQQKFLGPWRGIVIYQTILSAYAHALARALIFHEGSGHQTNRYGAAIIEMLYAILNTHVHLFVHLFFPSLSLFLILSPPSVLLL